MQTRKELKREAKALLKGHWGKAIGLNILQILPYILLMIFFIALLVLISVLVNQPSASDWLDQLDPSASFAGSDGRYFTNILTSLVGSLLMVGVNYTILDWLRTKDANFGVVRGIFSVFNKRDFLPVVVLWILQEIFTFLWTLLFFVPGIIKRYSYSQTYYIYKDIADQGGDDDLNYLDYVTKSRQLMNGHKFELFVLQLSFLGWDLLSLVTLGLSQIWVVPYKNATYMAYYRHLAGDRSEVEQPNDEQNAYFGEE
ncbi:hypothetical protein LFYK43_19300 [Ligilactobacillus salitolerans]|uniref:Integral membrane protein n=1 Tax=Ligilactobacillus salitolerans TaxID=1808352 RepID=A0A401IV93_9LACO|nr:DUF975 family protein [Ligilactobacillus salitolerans]GBG95471.1 hypothetical protein LFYK43_19300 [Ligilactobacillus salitolerans]